MQPDQAGAVGIETRRSSLEGDRTAVESRRRALDRLRAAFRGAPRGPVLITGEPGAGKSWLVDRFAEALPAGWRSAEVEIASAFDGLDVLRLAGDALGLDLPDRLGAARLRLGTGLREASADGRNWLLILDEVQRATAGAWEEIQALSNRNGRPGGFAAMILLGRTELARELAARRRPGWSGRLGLHIHLPPLDLDEARALLRTEANLSEPELEALHRDAMGNPRMMLRIAGSRRTVPRPVAESSDPGRRADASRLPRPLPGVRPRPAVEAARADDGIPTPEDDLPPPRLPSLIPARPPIRLEEGLVEVGWEGDLEAEPTRPDAPADRPGPAPEDEARRDEELVEDRYAALQAWAEWSRNRERPAPAQAEPAAVGDARDEGDDLGPDSAAGALPDDAGPGVASTVRAEPPQDFAPYSQLFSRIRHSL